MLQIGHGNDTVSRGAVSVAAQVRQIDALLAAGRLEDASELASAADRFLDELAAQQRSSGGMAGDFESNPLAFSEEQAADFALFQRSCLGLRGGANLLAGGDFEDVNQMTQLGWRHVQHTAPAVDTHVELTATDPKHGRYCLALHVAPRAAQPQTSVIELPCVWVISPAVPVDAGQMIEVTGWVRIDEALSDAGGGLQIFDSLGGPELSLVIRQTSGWQPFRLVRAVPESTELRLTLALAGLGSARLDAVMVRALAAPIARRLPATATESR
jgi:hypothetical protein